MARPEPVAQIGDAVKYREDLDDEAQEEIGRMSMMDPECVGTEGTIRSVDWSDRRGWMYEVVFPTISWWCVGSMIEKDGNPW